MPCLQYSYIVQVLIVVRRCFGLPAIAVERIHATSQLAEVFLSSVKHDTYPIFDPDIAMACLPVSDDSRNSLNRSLPTSMACWLAALPMRIMGPQRLSV